MRSKITLKENSNSDAGREQRRAGAGLMIDDYVRSEGADATKGGELWEPRRLTETTKEKSEFSR